MSSEYSYRKRRKENEEKKKKQLKAALIAIICFVAVTLIIVVALLIKNAVSKKDVIVDNNGNTQAEEEQIDESGKIADGISIETIAVGGMEFEEAMTAVNTYVEPLYDKELTIDVSGNTVSKQLRELGIACDVKAAVDEAFKMTEDEKAPGTIDIEFTLDDVKLTTLVSEDCMQYAKKAKNATIKRKDGEFIISKSKKGTKVNVEETKTAVYDEINNSLTEADAINVVAVIEKINPKYSSKALKKCTSLLGRFSTNYSEGQTARSANIKNAVSFINGTVLYPGDEFSVSGTISPLTADNGYSLAPSYQGGQVIDSLGGGVCQVSTTLYNAALRAEMEITDRSCHSMMVTYVKPSMDAAIAGDYKDMKFVNNLDMPVYIAGYAGGGTITFSIYGQETRPSNRTVEYVSVVTDTIQPGKDVVTKDKEQPESYEKVTQSAHVGYVADLYKVVYIDGVEKSREKINHSRYKAEPRHIIKGTKKEEDDDDEDEDEGSSKKQRKSSESSDDGGSGQSSEQPAEQPAELPASEQPAPEAEQPPEV